MKRSIFQLLLFFLFAGTVDAQSAGFLFTLRGSIDADTGTMQLMRVNDAYYPNQPGVLYAPVIKGRFVFTDSISYPSAYRVRLFRGSDVPYMSDLFLMDPGVQTIRCRVDSLREMPELDNLSSIESKNFAGQQGQQKKTAGLLKYTRDHPGSYVALWKLIASFSWDYEPVLDTVYALLSDQIRNTYTGRVLGGKLRAAAVLTPGRSFPRLPVLTVKRQPVLFPPITKKDRYTLVDFWYSHCGACISQFQELKNIFSAYQVKGFDIMSISIDGENLLTDWHQAILKYQLPWPQYLDLGGKEAEKLSIESYPTNFLLDSAGKIIMRDIGLPELNAFLKQHLPE